MGADKNTIQTSYNVRTGDGENYTRPEQHDDHVQYALRTGDCEDYTRPEKYDDHVHYNPCMMVHNTDVERQWIGNSLPRNQALKPSRKPDRITLRLQQIEEERAIQRREIEAERRAFAAERRALEEEYKLLEQLLSTNSENNHYRVSRRSRQERLNKRMEHTPKDDAGKGIFRNTSVGKRHHNQQFSQNMSKENEQTKQKTDHQPIELELTLARVESSSDQLQSNGTQQQKTSAISKASPNLCVDTEDLMKAINGNSISYVHPILSTTIPVLTIGASAERPVNNYAIGFGRSNKLYCFVFSHSLSDENGSRYAPRAPMRTGGDNVIRQFLCFAATATIAPERPTVWLILICAFVSSTAASCYSVMEYRPKRQRSWLFSFDSVLHRQLYRNMNGTNPSKRMLLLIYESFTVPLMLPYSLLHLSMGFLWLQTHLWKQTQLARMKQSGNTQRRLRDYKVKSAMEPSVVDGAEYSLRIDDDNKIITTKDCRHVGEATMWADKAKINTSSNGDQGEKGTNHEETEKINEESSRASSDSKSQKQQLKSMSVEQITRSVNKKVTKSLAVALKVASVLSKLDDLPQSIEITAAEEYDMELLVFEPLACEFFPTHPSVEGKTKLLKHFGATSSRVNPFRKKETTTNGSTIVSSSEDNKKQDYVLKDSSPRSDSQHGFAAALYHIQSTCSVVRNKYLVSAFAGWSSNSRINFKRNRWLAGSKAWAGTIVQLAGGHYNVHFIYDAHDVKEIVNVQDFSEFIVIGVSSVTMLKNRSWEKRLQSSTPMHSCFDKKNPVAGRDLATGGREWKLLLKMLGKDVLL